MRTVKSPVGKSTGIGKSRFWVVAGPVTGLAGIGIVRSARTRLARWARPIGGLSASVNVFPRWMLIGRGVVICGARTNGATFDSKPLCGSAGVPKATCCTTCTLLTPTKRPAGGVATIELSVIVAGSIKVPSPKSSFGGSALKLLPEMVIGTPDGTIGGVTLSINGCRNWSRTILRDETGNAVFDGLLL